MSVDALLRDSRQSVATFSYTALVLALSINAAFGEVNIETLQAELNKNPRRCANETVKLLTDSCRDAGSDWEIVQCQIEQQRRNDVILKWNDWVRKCNAERGTRPGPARQTVAPSKQQPAAPAATQSPALPSPSARSDKSSPSDLSRRLEDQRGKSDHAATRDAAEKKKIIDASKENIDIIERNERARSRPSAPRGQPQQERRQTPSSPVLSAPSTGLPGACRNQVSYLQCANPRCPGNPAACWQRCSSACND
jgi:hypothetical protein